MSCCKKRRILNFKCKSFKFLDNLNFWILDFRCFSFSGFLFNLSRVLITWTYIDNIKVEPINIKKKNRYMHTFRNTFWKQHIFMFSSLSVSAMSLQNIDNVSPQLPILLLLTFCLYTPLWTNIKKQFLRSLSQFIYVFIVHIQIKPCSCTLKFGATQSSHSYFFSWIWTDLSYIY